MNAMIEFVDTPCGWNPRTPADLREKAVSGISAWRSYSTARFLDGLAPTILHAIDLPDAPGDSGIRVELLPEPVARRWRSLGLRFATGTDLGGSDFPDILACALDLIRAAPPLRGTVTGLCRALHVLAVSGMDLDVSYSDPALPFSIFTSCTATAERNRVERLAENIAHEALHLQLTLVENTEPLVIEAPDKSLVFSPWKNKWRNVSGLVHAIYVFGNLRCFWERVSSELPEFASFARARIETIDGEMDAVRQFVTSDSLTATGQRLVRSHLAS